MTVPSGLERIGDETVREYLLRHGVEQFLINVNSQTVTFRGHTPSVGIDEIAQMFGLSDRNVVQGIRDVTSD